MTFLARAGLDRIPTYSPATLAGVDVDLRDNINLWGSPPAAIAALRACAGDVAQYPESGGRSLVTELASRIGVATDEVVAGCGSDDVIDSFMRAVALPGDLVAHPDPTFGMIPVFARLSGLQPVGVPLRPDGSADVDGLLDTGARVIYLCSPNNPTGTVTPAGEIQRLVERAPGVVLVDEAYAEFADAIDWRAKAPSMGNVLVTRTFSKAWGLAGLRVGYGVGGAALVAAVAKSRGPYKVSLPAEAAATATLRSDGVWMSEHVRAARAARDTLSAHLRQRRGVHPWPSHGNFVFASVDGSAREIAARFAARGIGVRAFEDLAGIGDAVRIGVAPADSMARVLRAAEEIWPCA